MSSPRSVTAKTRGATSLNRPSPASSRSTRYRASAFAPTACAISSTFAVSPWGTRSTTPSFATTYRQWVRMCPVMRRSNVARSSGRSAIPSYTCAVAGKIRVVVAKPGLDGHDRGAKIIARALRDAGMEVIYTGLHQTPEQIVETAIQEDADAVGISILSGAHMTLVPRILELLRENGVEDVVVVVGGTIPDDDADELRKLGVSGVFGPGAPTSEIVDFIRGAVPA